MSVPVKPNEYEDMRPPLDESGEVDLSLIDYMLRLTPAQRLSVAEEFADFILTARRAAGIDGSIPRAAEAAH